MLGTPAHLVEAAKQPSLLLNALLRRGLCVQRLRALLNGFRHQLGAATVPDVAALVWALPYISRPYTRSLARKEQALLEDLAALTLPAIQRVVAQRSASPGGPPQAGPGTQAAPPAARPEDLVQLAVGFTQAGYYPGAEWMRAHRLACIELQHYFTPENRQRLRAAYQALLNA